MNRIVELFIKFKRRYLNQDKQIVFKFENYNKKDNNNGKLASIFLKIQK